MSRLNRLLTRLIFLFLGFLFFSAGMGKLVEGHRFPGLMGPVWLIDELAQYHLTLYGQFIAWSQIFIGFLLLTHRFRTLGSIMLMPMLLNIFMVTLSLEWTGTPWVVGVFLIMNCWLFVADRHVLIPLLIPGFTRPETRHPVTVIPTLIWLSGLMLVVASVPLSSFSSWLTIGLAGAGIGLALYSNRW